MIEGCMVELNDNVSLFLFPLTRYVAHNKNLLKSELL